MRDKNKINYKIGDLVHEAHRPHVLGLVVGIQDKHLIVNWVSEDSNRYPDGPGPEILPAHYVTLVRRGDHEE
jgi:hypothetical protein